MGVEGSNLFKEVSQDKLSGAETPAVVREMKKNKFYRYTKTTQRKESEDGS